MKEGTTARKKDCSKENQHKKETVHEEKQGKEPRHLKKESQ